MSEEQKPWGPRERQQFVERQIGLRKRRPVPPIDLMPEDLPALLECETRMVQNHPEGVMHAWWEQEVFYRGAWLKVGKTDLFDNVATGNCAGIPEDQTLTVALLAPRSYGARVQWGCLSFITHLSDG